jgi:predicted HTH transcriptional regulator
MKHSKFKVFISGNQKELKQERLIIKAFITEDILLKKHFEAFIFEETPARGKSSKATYLEELKDSDIYIGLIGKKYGNIGSDGLSATEREFRHAKHLDKEILIYLKGANDLERDAKINSLIQEIKKDSGYVYKRFTDIPELKSHIFESLVVFLECKGVISKLYFDASICADATFKDIDEDKLNWFLQIAKSRRSYAIDDGTPSVDILTHLNLLSDGKLTNAAILLFGKNPQKFHIQAEVKCLQVHGTEIEKPFKTYQIYKGSVFEEVDKALDFVLARLKRPVIPEVGKATTKRPFEVPEFVIREAIVNAIAHRDYNSSAAVQIIVYADRIEIWNPGKLPPQLSIDALKKPHPSFPNNPLICEPLYLAQYIEKAGSGTLEMFKQCREKGLPGPEFSQKMGHFITTIWREKFTEEYLTGLGFNERQLKAVQYVKEKGRITNREYRQLTELSDEGARRDLNDIVKKKVFKIKGRGRSISYVLYGI